MATAKKATTKKPARKSVIAKKAPVKALEAAQSVPAGTNEVAPEGKRKRGRPPGVRAVKRASNAGRKAATEFLYSIRDSKAVGDDSLGLDGPSENSLTAYVGPFANEDAAMTAALNEIGNDATKEVVLFKDYRRGRVEVRRRLV